MELLITVVKASKFLLEGPSSTFFFFNDVGRLMDKFFADAVKKTEQRGKETGDATTEVATDGEALKKFPRGVVLGKDGKP